MLWALIINICLSGNGQTECRTWRVEPFDTAYECQREGRKLIAGLGRAEADYINTECQIGFYS